MNEWMERLQRLPVANISDVRDSFGVLDPAILPIVPGLAGPALTVKCYPGSIITVHKALTLAKPGDILVVDGEGDMRGALMGELMALDAQRRGLAGVVIDGPIRDVAGLKELGLPVYARGTNPRVGTNRRVGRVGVPVTVGGVVIQPGDYLVGDEDGLAVIPAAELASTVLAGEAKNRKEAEWAARIRSGDELIDLVNMRHLIS